MPVESRWIQAPFFSTDIDVSSTPGEIEFRKVEIDEQQICLFAAGPSSGYATFNIGDRLPELPEGPYILKIYGNVSVSAPATIHR